MRYILLLLMISALGVGLACQSSAFSSDEIKFEKPAEKAALDKPVAESHDEHEDDDTPRISLADAKKDFDAGDAVFVDTRGKSSYDTEHVKGALNVPLNEFDKSYESIPKDKKIIAYCS